MDEAVGNQFVQPLATATDNQIVVSSREKEEEHWRKANQLPPLEYACEHVRKKQTYFTCCFKRTSRLPEYVMCVLSDLEMKSPSSSPISVSVCSVAILGSEGACWWVLGERCHILLTLLVQDLI